MTLISQQCRAKCSKGARQSSIRGMKSELASPGARESLSWGWDRAGSSKAAERAAVHGAAEAQDQDIPQHQREEQLHNPCTEQIPAGEGRAMGQNGPQSQVGLTAVLFPLPSPACDSAPR